MSTSLPFFFAFVIFAGFFFWARTRGVVSLLSSGVSLAIALVVFLLGMKYAPGLAANFAEMNLEWKTTAGIAGGAAAFVFLVVRLLGGWMIKAAMGPDGPFHFCADGFCGGLVSLIPSTIIIFFVFTCIRISGTLHELNYTASLSRDAVAERGQKIPPYPWTAEYRNSVEDIPFVAVGLDWIDPFSNRRNRNAAAFATMNQSSLIRSYLLSQPETAELAAAQPIIDLNRDPDVFRTIENHDRVALVLNAKVRETAAMSGLSSKLRDLRLQPILVGYARSLTPPPAAEPIPN